MFQNPALQRHGAKRLADPGQGLEHLQRRWTDPPITLPREAFIYKRELAVAIDKERARLKAEGG